MESEANEIASPITIRRVDGLELHVQYGGQNSPQPCYVCLDTETGELWAEASAVEGVRVWHGIVRRWRVPALKADAANALLEEVAPLAAQIYYDSATVWDGHNHVGELSEDALDAEEEIGALIERHEPWSEYERISIWDAHDWYGGIGGRRTQRLHLNITAATTDEQLAALIEHEEGVAEGEGVDVLNGAAEYLTALRDEAVEELVGAVGDASEYLHDTGTMRAWILMRVREGAEQDAEALAAALDATLSRPTEAS